MVILSSCAAIHTAEPPLAVDGVLDLTHWDFNNNGKISLNGEWEMYWGQLLSPGDFAVSNPRPLAYRLIKLPRLWNDFEMDGHKLDGTGYASFRLRLKWDRAGETMAIKVPAIYSSYRLWLDNSLLCSCGNVSSNKMGSVMEMVPKVVYFHPAPGNHQLVIQVANFWDRAGGIGQEMLMGTASQISKYRETNIGFEVCIFGILFIISIYHFLLFPLWKKDPSPLFFGIFCLLFAFRAVFEGENFFLYLLPGVGTGIYMKLWFVTYYLCLPSLYYFFLSMFPKEFSKLLGNIFFLCAIVFSLIAIVTPLEIYVHTLIGYHLIVFLGVICTTYGLVMANIRKRTNALIVIIASLIFIITAIHDLLISSQMVSQTLSMYISPSGFIIFVLMQAYIISSKYAGNFDHIERLSANLEKKVEERTKELYLTMEMLKARNLTMENELKIARQIQMNLIPVRSDYTNISFYYKPMEEVGGDFFDFFLYQNDGSIGIFISDVSGHGVPAAFITSMIKTSLLQMAPHINDPAYLLMLLNNSMIRQTAGNFITAFYGIFNPATREFNYSNAGHNLPYIINKDVVKNLPQQLKGIPLAILSSEELQEYQLEFSNNTVRLEAGSKLLLYTDGLVEAVNSIEKVLNPGTPDFESSGMLNFLQDLLPLPSKEFIYRLSDALIHFRGSEDFDDDVCMVCLDVE